MVKKTDNQAFRGGPPPLDESWWTSLLSEEEKPRQIRESAAQPARQKREPRQSGVDWEHAQQLYALDDVICLKIFSYNKGGLLVEGGGLKGFVPVSHLVNPIFEGSEERRDQELTKYIGQDILLKVIECDPERGRLIFSERAAQSDPGSRPELLCSLKIGSQLWGTVTNITDFGVFVDLGGLEGLIHVSELSWGRVRHPSDSLSLGEKVKVYVMHVDGERSRVALSVKRLFPNPWEVVNQRYQPGQVVEAVVTAILPFGAFARLEDGLDGLIHVSEMAPPGEQASSEATLQEGQLVKVRILQIDAGKQRIGLSMHLDREL